MAFMDCSRNLLKKLHLEPIFRPITNPYCLFGLLWGLPIPLIVIGLHFWWDRRPFYLDSGFPALEKHPIFWILLLHPIIFAIAFGITGAILQNKNQRINELINRLHNESVTDPLTHLFNRRRLTLLLQRELRRAQQHSTPLTLMLLDLDHFKRVNDEYGHLVGDHVLCNLAQVLENCIRPYDFVGRWGGEEFLVILPHTTMEHALIVAERCRKTVMEQRHFAGKKTCFCVTVSIGVAEAKSDDTPSSLTNKADTALYLAKHVGRNNIQVYSPASK